MYRLGALFLLGSLALSSALPPCVCPKNLKPVCGSDGHTYNNECLLRCAQVHEPHLSLERQGRCLGRSRSVRQAEVNCFCTYEYMPFCGTDGVTYSNRCALNCARQTTLVEVAHPGECRSKRDIEIQLRSRCTCTRNLAPVCGSDGTTYSNPCVLDCISQNMPGLHAQHDGPCGVMPCTCSREMKPVCGTDGITYDNACYLNCAKDRQDDLELLHEGECGTRDEVQVVDPSLCVCTREGRPVCGTDGNSYDNPCLLQCARQNDETLRIDYEGQCDHRVKVVEIADNVPCTCTRNFKPVCASNGVTFSNKCLMRCAGTHLTVTKEGPCEDPIQYH